jgi:hypothetical protein
VRRHPYSVTVRRLAEALGLDETAGAALLAAAQPCESATRAVAVVPTRSLPLPLSSFVGREPEIAAIQQLLETARLVTLTGAGGIGKTRLALEVARASADAYPDSTTLVLLAPVAHPELVASSIAQALDLRDRADPPLSEMLIACLRPAVCCWTTSSTSSKPHR